MHRFSRPAARAIPKQQFPRHCYFSLLSPTRNHVFSTRACMSSSPTTKKDTHSLTLHKLAERGLPQKAMAYVGKMLCEPETKHHNYVLQAFAKAAFINKSKIDFDENSTRETATDTNYHHAKLYLCQWIEEFQAGQAPAPNVASFTILMVLAAAAFSALERAGIHSAANLSCTSELTEWFDRMTSMGVAPDLHLYTFLAEQKARAKDIAGLRCVMHRMEASGVGMNGVGVFWILVFVSWTDWFFNSFKFLKFPEQMSPSFTTRFYHTPGFHFHDSSSPLPLLLPVPLQLSWISIFSSSPIDSDHRSSNELTVSFCPLDAQRTLFLSPV